MRRGGGGRDVPGGLGQYIFNEKLAVCVNDVGLTIFKSFTPWSTEATTCSVFVSDIVKDFRVVLGFQIEL